MKPVSTQYRIVPLLILALGLLLLIWPVSVFAQDAVPHPVDGIEDCRFCHEEGLNGSPQFPEDHADRSNGSCTGCHEATLTRDSFPVVPHVLEFREDCSACHENGVLGAPQYPEDHAGRADEVCLLCHKPIAENAPGIPHEIEGRENCLACHVAREGEEEVEGEFPLPPPTPTPEPTPAPLEYPQPEGDVNTCFDCHVTESGATGEVAHEWEESIHAEREVVCADCHGGDPAADTVDGAHSTAAGYIGKPDRTEIPNLCGGCHANVTLMRQYDIPTDQLAKYEESFHGLRLAGGDTKVATCYDCHDGHATRQTNDPAASVYTFNIPGLCADCHADEEYMAPYDIPTDQFALYEHSVHGIALLENLDPRAPSCATCHGTHGAAPPGFSEVANVCGSCHSATQDYFLSSPHNSDNPAAPKCVTCHGRYDVGEPSEAMFVGDDPRHCGSCHAPDSAIGQTVSDLHLSLTDASATLDEASAAVERAAALGRIVEEERSLLADARTHLITARAAQHTVDLEVVRREVETSVDLSLEAKVLAESGISASRFRRVAMVIAVAAIVLIIISLIMLRREHVSSRDTEDR